MHRSQGIAPEKTLEIMSRDIIKMEEVLADKLRFRGQKFVRALRAMVCDEWERVNPGQPQPVDKEAGASSRVFQEAYMSLLCDGDDDFEIPARKHFKGRWGDNAMLAQFKKRSFEYVNESMYLEVGRWTLLATRKTGTRGDVYGYNHSAYTETDFGVGILPLDAKGHKEGTNYVDTSYIRHSGVGLTCHPLAHKLARLTCFAAMEHSAKFEGPVKNPLQWLVIR